MRAFGGKGQFAVRGDRQPRASLPPPSTIATRVATGVEAASRRSAFAPLFFRVTRKATSPSCVSGTQGCTILMVLCVRSWRRRRAHEHQRRHQRGGVEQGAGEGTAMSHGPSAIFAGQPEGGRKGWVMAP